jgi:predicted DNA-binding transcriptional regulator YafY
MHRTSTRLLRLLALLQARRYWTGPELAQRLEVTRRTIRRDIDRLRALGYPVRSSAGVAGGYQLGAGAALPPLLLDDEEALAVTLGLRTAAAGTVRGVETAALRALGKLERVLPTRLRAQMQAMHGAVAPLYLVSPRVDPATLATLAAACGDGHLITFAYTDRQGASSRRTTEPHGLVHTGARWYLVAWDRDRADWRTFRVDRIDGEPAAGARFARREVPGGDTAAFVSASIALGPYPLRAVVVFHAPVERVAPHIAPLAGCLRALDETRCILESGGHSLAELAVHIATIGEEFEVREPAALRHYVQELAGRLGRATQRDTEG